MTAPLPPPADLNSRRPKPVTIAKGQALFRFHTYGPAQYEPIFFDTGLSGRLNAPDGSYGTLYVARHPRGSFVETFRRDPQARLIDRALIDIKAFAELTTTRTLRLAPLTGDGLGDFGVRADIVHCDLEPGPDPYPHSHAWSAALHKHPAHYDGIAYRSRHDDDELCYALFDRCASAITVAKRVTNLDQSWFWDLMDHYKVAPTP